MPKTDAAAHEMFGSPHGSQHRTGVFGVTWLAENLTMTIGYRVARENEPIRYLRRHVFGFLKRVANNQLRRGFSTAHAALGRITGDYHAK